VNTDWHENTAENPFWLHRGPIEVERKSGARKIIGCPSCARREPDIVKWRNLAAEELVIYEKLVKQRQQRLSRND
jgi:two-component SAPR family response regulator